MAQQVKATKELDLKKRARIVGRQVIKKTGHYSVVEDDSGKLLAANNSSQAVYFTLPLANTGDGLYYNFFNMNTNSMCVNSVESGGAILFSASANATHLVNSVNLGDTQRLGKSCQVWGDGTRWYLVSAGFTINTDRIVAGA